MTTATKTNGKPKMDTLGDVSNGAESIIDMGRPYDVAVTVIGDCPILFHAFNVESVDAKSKAKKGSVEKKTDDVESYVYRTPEGHLGLPGLNFCAAIAYAGKRHQDPSSSRKSAYDLLRASIIPLNEIEPFEPKRKDWDKLDVRRACVQRAAIPRARPMLFSGWRITFNIRVLMPSLVSEEWLRQLIKDAGAFCAIGDHRPTYGRFSICGWKVTTPQS